MKRALISVSDKTGIVEFASQLQSFGYSIISTGGTSIYLEESGISTTSVESITGYPELLDGRVKTLHPAIHGGVLSIRNNPKHDADLVSQHIKHIDIVCVNLYPFEDTILQASTTHTDAMEQIDIGGTALLRSAAKNHQYVTVVSDPEDYQTVLQDIQKHGETTIQTRTQLAIKAFQTTAHYDAVIASYLAKDSNPYTKTKTLTYHYHNELRYGENPHQTAAMYKSPTPNPYSLFEANQRNGQPLSYNNIQDANAALNILHDFEHPTVVALKHMNPCGVATADTITQAFDNAYDCDSVSIFGGIVACNRTITKDLATKLSKIFIELIIAPAYDTDALAILQQKKNLRVLELDVIQPNTEKQMVTHINGGILIQDVDNLVIDPKSYQCVTNQKPSSEMLLQLQFAWTVVKHVKSNAIVVTKGTQTVGIGSGQMNRVGAAKIALDWAREHGHTTDLVLASDAFFPFDDVVKLAASYGVKAIIQPGGSIRDQQSIDACNELGIIMVFTHHRHFKH